MMRVAILAVALMVCGCRTEPFFVDMGPATPMITDQMYEAHVLATDAERIGIFERSPEGGFCAYVVIVSDRNMTQGFATPPGWSAEHEWYLPYRDDCFALDPFSVDGWGAEAIGAITFGTVQNGTPCTLSIHAQSASHLTEQGATRPANIVANVDFDADNLAVHNACLMH
jgi:hypothetical protein